MKRLIEATQSEKAILGTRAALESGRSPVLITGLAPVHRALAAAALTAEEKRPVVVICADETEAGRMAADLSSLLGAPAETLAGRDLSLLSASAASRSRMNGGT